MAKLNLDNVVFKCPHCGSDELRVVDSRKREKKDGEQLLRRRRRCLGCNASFTTYEIPKQVHDKFYEIGVEERERSPLEDAKIYRAQGGVIFIDRGDSSVTLTIAGDEGQQVTVTLYNRDYKPNLDNFIDAIICPRETS